MSDGIYQVAGSGSFGESCKIRSRATCLNLGILDHQHCHAFWTILAGDGGALLYITASTSFVRMSATAHMEKTGVIQKRHLGGGFSMYNNCVEPVL
jgi:hypothetical protein